MPRRSDSRGFTLIETLAAVVIFALAMTMIILAQSEGAAFSGDAVRRAEASRWAEQLLVELEQASATGTPIQPGTRELTEERAGIEYAASLEIAPLDPAEVGLVVTPPPARAGASASDAPASQGGGVFAANAPQPVVYQAILRVHWTEGAVEREVTRASFFLNGEALEALAPGEGEEPEQ